MVVNMTMPPCRASLASLVVVWGAASRQSAYVLMLFCQNS